MFKLRSGHVLKNPKIETTQEPFERFDLLEDELLNDFRGDGDSLNSKKEPFDKGAPVSDLNSAGGTFGQTGINLNEYVLKAEVNQREKAAYQKGFQQGRDEGIRLGQEEIHPYIQALQTILKEWEERKEKLFKENEVVIVQLAFEIARKVVHKEISTNPDLILYVVREALKKVEQGSYLIIKLNPEDVAVFERGMKIYLPEIKQFNDIQIVPEKSIERGGCILESDSGIINAELDMQLQKIEESLLEEKHDEK